MRRRAADGADLLVRLDASSPRPLYAQLYDGLREAILTGRLRGGARLPSTRVLAADLGVSRNTVVLAYERLRVEGYVAGRRGGGTRVRPVLPDPPLSAKAAGAIAPGAKPPATTPTAAGGAISATRGPLSARAGGDSPRARAAADLLASRGAVLAAAGASFPVRSGTPPIPFWLGVPALDAFPARLWGRLSARRWRRGGVVLGDGDPAGEPALREAIAAYVANARGARCTPDQVFVVSGMQQGVDLAARLLLDPGDAVWVEEPGYPGAHATLRAAGARLVPVPVDEDGVDVATGERAAPDARMAYVTPSNQFPLGAVLSAARRLALLDWAHRAGAWILEDDYDSEFRFAGRPLVCLQGLEAERRGAAEPARVIYIGTFSKTLVPGLRLGYLIVPDALVDAFRAARAAIDRHPPTPLQLVLADFIGEGHYARHVRRVRALYAERQATLLAAAEAELSGLLELAPAATGLHLVGWLPEDVVGAAAEAAAAAEGVRVYALSRYSIAPSPRPARDGLVLGYAGFDDAAIRAGVSGLRRALATLVRVGGASGPRAPSPQEESK